MSITVTPVNDAPVADAKSVSTAEDIAVGMTLSGTDVDGDALTFAVVTGPAHGTLSGTGATPDVHAGGELQRPGLFTFRANDGTVDSNVATVSITVTPVNDAPVADATVGVDGGGYGGGGDVDGQSMSMVTR